ncbi:MAG: hypothetical protein CME68_05565 [Halobacteriovoraceae bacterium]|nr:hypothetical protein [Halobacteriovoraceae bacterium]
MNKFMANPKSLRTFVITAFGFILFFFGLFQASAKAMTIPFPVTIQCQDGERVIYVPLVKGGAPLVPKCVANI